MWPLALLVFFASVTVPVLKMIGLGYFLASEMLSNSGQVFNLNPALVTWIPTLALLAITLVALSRVR